MGSSEGRAAPYTIEVDETRRLVTVTVTGVVDVSVAKPMVAAARGAAGPRNFNILYDFRTAIPGDVKNTDLFWIPRTLPGLQEPSARQLRVALLHRAAQRSLAQFWETTFTNVGLQARAFEDDAAAFAWLGAPAGA